MSSKILMLVLLLSAGSLWAQEKKESAPPAAGAVAAPTMTDADKAKKNPAKFNEISVQRGKKIYMTQCALCHGAKGDGKGELAEDMKLKLSDFTAPDTLKDRSDGELFWVVSNGKDPMPGQSGRMTEVQRWNLVNYLRALSGKVPEKATGKEPEENVILIPQ